MRSCRERDADEGFTLIEVIISVAILGIGFTALLGTLGVAFSGSHSFRDESDAKTVVISAAERVKSVVYVPCAVAADYLTTARLVGNEYPSNWGTQAAAQNQISVREVRYWNGTTFVTDRAFCLANTSRYLQLEQVIVTATSPGNRAIEVIAVVKRGPT
jgi:prepilin-type N-terminal cleavage/methylation domain-containing protein